MEDPTFSEMADYIDTRDDFFEKLSPPPSGGNGSKQVKKIHLKINFFGPCKSYTRKRVCSWQAYPVIAPVGNTPFFEEMSQQC